MCYFLLFIYFSFQTIYPGHSLPSLHSFQLSHSFLLPDLLLLSFPSEKSSPSSDSKWTHTKYIITNAIRLSANPHIKAGQGSYKKQIKYFLNKNFTQCAENEIIFYLVFLDSIKDTCHKGMMINIYVLTSWIDSISLK